MYKSGSLKIKLHIYISHWLHPLFSDINHLNLYWVLILSFWFRKYFISTLIHHLWIIHGQVSLPLTDIYGLWSSTYVYGTIPFSSVVLTLAIHGLQHLQYSLKILSVEDDIDQSYSMLLHWSVTICWQSGQVSVKPKNGITILVTLRWV